MNGTTRKSFVSLDNIPVLQILVWTDVTSDNTLQIFMCLV